MASTYSTNLAIELIGTGDQAGTWGNTTNTNLGTLIEQAISGYVTQAVATGTDTTITIPNGATGVARNMFIELTGTGGTNTNLIVPANKKLYFIYNNTTGAVTVKVSGQTGVSVAQGTKVILASNGTDVIEATTYLAAVPASLSVTNISAASLTVTTGNAAFTGTGQRITGDMSNATPANRLSFQSSTTNGNTTLGVLPNGTATAAVVSVFANNDPANTSLTAMGVNSAVSESFFNANRTGTGTYLPMTFYTNGAEKARLTVSGNLLVGTTTDVSGLSGVISDVAGNVRNIPSAGTAKTSAYTLAVSDLGEFVTVGSGGSITVPNDTFAAGNAVSIYNDTTGNISINCPITTAYIAGTNTDKASMTLSTRGVATILFVNPSLCVATGNLS